MGSVDMNGIIKCPVCGNLFCHNTMSIYKLIKDNKTIWYCSYTCWREAGGDSGKRKYARRK
jgi:hypothetical protein